MNENLTSSIDSASVKMGGVKVNKNFNYCVLIINTYCASVGGAPEHMVGGLFVYVCYRIFFAVCASLCCVAHCVAGSNG